MKKKVLSVSLILLINLIFIDIVSAETYNNYTSATVSCGSGMMTNIPSLLPKVISIIYNIIQIAVPVVLVIMGSLDLMKGITAGKEDEMKKGQQLFIKRLISAALIFFVFIIVKLVISFVADNSTNSIMDCAECFINNECKYSTEEFTCEYKIDDRNGKTVQVVRIEFYISQAPKAYYTYVDKYTKDVDIKFNLGTQCPSTIYLVNKGNGTFEIYDSIQGINQTVLNLSEVIK